MSECKSCNADIVWIKYNGKNHPIDAKPKKLFVMMDDPQDGSASWELTDCHESHFATCPNAAQHRNRT